MEIVQWTLKERVPVFVCDPGELGRLAKSNSEDLNIVPMDERMHEMEIFFLF